MCTQWRLRSAWASIWVLSYPLSAQRRLWSDWADAQADLRLRWSHSHLFVLSWGGSFDEALSCSCSAIKNVQKDAEENHSTDSDQTAPRSRVIWVDTLCSNLFFPYLLSWAGNNNVWLTEEASSRTVCCKQVAQRATIAHLSPMCQGQILFQKTYKWAMETRGPKSNSSKLLCLSLLSATLMMIRSKMNELAWRHHFPIINLWEIF